MLGPLPEADIIKLCLKGVRNAQKAYESWSDEWLWNAPEYFLTVEIARAIGTHSSSKYITLENRAETAIKDAGARGKGRLHSAIRQNGRFDILLWWSNETPRAPIEVKCQIMRFEKIKSDVERISKVLHRNKSTSSISFGLVVFYASCKNDHSFTAKERLQKSLDNILSEARNFSGKTCKVHLHQTTIKVVEDSAWVGAVLLLKTKNV